MALGQYVPGDENHDWTTNDLTQLNGTELNQWIQQPLIVAMQSIAARQTYLKYTGYTGGTIGAAGLVANTDTTAAFDTVYKNTLGATFQNKGGTGSDANYHTAVVVPIAGYYSVSASVAVHFGATTNAFAAYYVTGITYNAVGSAANVGVRGKDFIVNQDRNYTAASAYLQCAVGDKIGVWYYSTTAASVGIQQSETNLIVNYLGT